MEQRQVNIRLNLEDIAVLEAAAFLDDRSLAEETREALLERVEARKAEGLVREALAARAARAKEKAVEGRKVSSLDAKRDRARGKGA